ncbi:hypothetical protein BgiMline_027924, partial [Biomphalaria glabrata]
PKQLVPSTTCSNLALVYMAETPIELLRLSLLNQPNCLVIQSWETDYQPFLCYRSQTFT